MDLSILLIIALFVSFIALMLLGVQVAYALGGLSFIFTVIAMSLDRFGGTFIGLDFKVLSLIVNRIFQLLDNIMILSL